VWAVVDEAIGAVLMEEATITSQNHEKLCFNPYWVFQCAATICCFNYNFIYCFVSIPIGFSNALRRNGNIGKSFKSGVSIPIGFSNALRRSGDGVSAIQADGFQSLLGFPMRCDVAG